MLERGCDLIRPLGTFPPPPQGKASHWLSALLTLYFP